MHIINKVILVTFLFISFFSITQEKVISPTTLHGYWIRQDGLVIKIFDIDKWDAGGLASFHHKGNTGWNEICFANEFCGGNGKKIHANIHKFSNIKHAGDNTWKCTELWFKVGKDSTFTKETILTIDKDLYAFKNSEGLYYFKAEPITNSPKGKDDFILVREKIKQEITELFSEAQKAIQEEKFDQAKTTYQTILTKEPSNNRAKEELEKLNNKQKEQNTLEENSETIKTSDLKQEENKTLETVHPPASTPQKDLAKETYLKRLEHYQSVYNKDFSNISKDNWNLFNDFDNQIQNRFDEIANQDKQNKAFWDNLKISPQLTPQEQITSYNQKLRSIADKYNTDLNNAVGNAQTFMNQNSGQEGALTGALIVGGVSAMSAKSAQKDAEKRLKNELTSNFKKVQRDLLSIEEPKKLTAQNNAARALSAEAEQYYLEIYNYWNCRVSGIKNGFSIYSTDWINPNCKTYEKKKIVDQVPYNSETYLEIAKRKKSSSYEFLQPYAYHFLEKALAIDNKNVKAAISYYNWLTKDIIDKRKNESSIAYKNDEKLNDIISFCGYPTNDISTIRQIVQSKLVGENGYYVTQKGKKVFDTTYFVFKRDFEELENKSTSYLYLAINANPNLYEVKDGLTYYLATKDHSQESFQTYQSNFPNGNFTNEAQNALNYFKTINHVNDLIQNDQFYEAGKSITSLKSQFPELIKFTDFKNGKDANYALSRFHLENSSNLKSIKKSGKIDKLKSLYKTQIDYQSHLTNKEKLKLNRKINTLRNKIEGNDFSYSLGISLFNQTNAFIPVKIDQLTYDQQSGDYISTITNDSIAYTNMQAIWNTFNLDFRFYNHLLTIYKGLYLGLEYGFSISAMRNASKISEENTNTDLFNTVENYANGSSTFGYGSIPDTLFLASPSRIHVGFSLSKYLFIRYNRYMVFAYNEKNNWMNRTTLLTDGFRDRSYDLLSFRLELPFGESKRFYIEKTTSTKNNFYNQLEIGCSFAEKNGVTFDISFKHAYIQPLYNYESAFEITNLNTTTKYSSNGNIRAQLMSINLAIGIPSIMNLEWKSSRKNTSLSQINLFD